MKITAIRTRIFKENEDLIKFIIGNAPSIKERSILVVTSKIVALAEGRTAEWKDEDTKIKLIKSESEIAIHTPYTWLTIKDGMVMSSAGIDESNADGKLILLPKDSFKTAALLRKKLKKIFRIKDLGILIPDSRLLPLRAGVTAVAIGYAGFKGIRDYRNTPDIFGRNFKVSKTDVADSLATAAVLLMGEGREQQPLAIIENAPIEFSNHTNRNELYIDVADDLYGPIFSQFNIKER